MPCEYCHYCSKIIDLDYCCEHFPDAYWETEGEDHGKCQNELDEEEMKMNWNSLTTKQKMIRRSIHIYYFVLLGIKPNYNTWMDC